MLTVCVVVVVWLLCGCCLGAGTVEGWLRFAQQPDTEPLAFAALRVPVLAIHGRRDATVKIETVRKVSTDVVVVCALCAVACFDPFAETS